MVHKVHLHGLRTMADTRMSGPCQHLAMPILGSWLVHTTTQTGMQTVAIELPLSRLPSKSFAGLSLHQAQAWEHRQGQAVQEGLLLLCCVAGMDREQ